MKNKLKQTLDYIPFILLVIYTVYQWLNDYVTNIVIPYRTYAGIILLLINAVIYAKYHKIAVLFTGLICLLGFCGIITVSPSLITGEFGGNLSSASFLIRTGDVCFFGIFIIHLIISFRYYVGILSKKYWKELVINKANKM